MLKRISDWVLPGIICVLLVRQYHWWALAVIPVCMIGGWIAFKLLMRFYVERGN